MRCLILIALCFVLANAYHSNTNRFHKLLNRYQRQGYQPYQQNLFGSDDLDNHIDEYVEQIRRERMFDRDQCPRDFEDFLGQEDDEYETYDPEEMYGQSTRRHRRTFPTEEMTEDMPYGDEETQWGQETEGRRCHGRQCYGRQWTDETEGMGYGRQFGQETAGMGYGQEWGQEEEFGTEGMEQTRPFYGEEETTPRTTLLKEVRDANVKLTCRLYEQVKHEKDDKNTVVSPIAIQVALATLNAGARGNTRRQIAHVIAGNLKTQERKQIFRTLIRHLKGNRNTEYTTPTTTTTKLNIVTGLFVTPRIPTKRQFLQLVMSVHGATVKKCPFTRPQQCRQQINQWMSQKTQHKINQIVPQDAITDNTKMVLVSALNIKATWGPQMRRHVTKQAKFYPLDTKKVKTVEVMETEGSFKYYEDELVKIVGVPTKQHELTLYTIVPKAKDGLTEVEKLHLEDSVQLKQLLEKTDKHTRRCHVQLPKFQIKHKVDVRRTLRKQGVTDAFDSQRADFSGITGISKYQEDQMEETYGQTSFRRNPFMDTETMFGQQGRFDRNPFFETEMETGMGGQMGQRETKIHLNKFIHQCSIKITENGITATTGSQTEETYEPYTRRFGGMETGRFGGYETEGMDTFDETTGMGTTGTQVVKANRAFAFVLKHNPTQQVIMVGRVIDAAQKKTNQVPQTINTVDQL
jgi:serpin B